MKKLSSLKLNQLSKVELEKREMNALKGGNCCGCGCNYAGSGGGSSVETNYQANERAGHTGSYGGTYYCGCGSDMGSGKLNF